MPDVTAVIFDLGQVLVAWDPTRVFAPALTPEQSRELLEAMEFSEFNHRLDMGEDYRVVRADLARRHPGFEVHLDTYHDHMADSIAGPVPGSEQIVADLAAEGTALFGLSNWPADSFHLAAQHAPAVRQLRDIVVSGREGLAKPDPAIFHLAIDRFGIVPDQTVFVDDVPRNVAGAIDCGLRAIQFVDAAQLRRDLAGLGLLAGAPA